MVLPVNFDQYMAALDLIRRLQSTVRDQSTELDQLRRQSGGSNGHQLLDQITQLQRDLVAANAQVDQLTQKNSQLTVELEAAKTDINRLKAARIQPEPATPESSRSEPRTTQKSHINIVFPSVSSSASASTSSTPPSKKPSRSEQHTEKEGSVRDDVSSNEVEVVPGKALNTMMKNGVIAGFTCAVCPSSEIFETKSQVYTHRYNRHAIGPVKMVASKTGNTVELCRQTDEKFHCPCKKYQNVFINYVVAHVKSCSGIPLGNTTSETEEAQPAPPTSRNWNTVLTESGAVQWRVNSKSYELLRNATKTFKLLHNLPRHSNYLCSIPQDLMDEYMIHMQPHITNVKQLQVNDPSEKPESECDGEQGGGSSSKKMRLNEDTEPIFNEGEADNDDADNLREPNSPESVVNDFHWESLVQSMMPGYKDLANETKSAISVGVDNWLKLEAERGNVAELYSSECIPIDLMASLGEWLYAEMKRNLGRGGSKNVASIRLWIAIPFTNLSARKKIRVPSRELEVEYYEHFGFKLPKGVVDDDENDMDDGVEAREDEHEEAEEVDKTQSPIASVINTEEGNDDDMDLPPWNNYRM
ncbi:hypothetical protein HDU79_004127 [Rhizoclosmatium sp. JEL0117]|nr:hypothetical protein HDU79_004127 [Rhizoclosmatium sp. JEL0117]